MYSIPQNTPYPVPVQASFLSLPLAQAPVRAGFPSPAEDFGNQRLELSNLLVKHPLSTFMLRVRGDSMVGAGIFDGDLLVVDKMLTPQHGDIVVAEIDGDFTCKRYWARGGQIILRAENPTYPDIRPQPEQTLEIWGVVISCVKQFRA